MTMSKAQKIFQANQKYVLDDVARYHKQNPEDVIVFDEIFPLVGNNDFTELALKKKIKFTSQKDTKWAEKFSQTLSSVMRNRAGNPNGGLNTIIPANNFAEEMGSLLDWLDEEGYKTLQSKADFLNIYEITTLREKEWSSATIQRTHGRWQKIKAKNQPN